VDHVWPVNSLAFHPSYNTFASAGSDATVSIWDHKVKKRLRQYPKFRGGVAAVAFNCDGSRIAVGVSCTWDEGEAGFKANPVRPWLGVRKVGDEVKVWDFRSYPNLPLFYILFFFILTLLLFSQNHRETNLFVHYYSSSFQ
jgi:WD40 repeat protein